MGYLAAVLLATGIAIAVMAAVRRRLRGTQDGMGSGFTLATARDLRNQGLVSEEEYAQIRRTILGPPQPAEGAEKTAGG
jgi:hypothetical protein